MLSSTPVDPQRWRQAGRRLVAKAIAELSYEEILTPLADGAGYRLAFGAVTYYFRAGRGGCATWRVDPASVRRSTRGADAPAEDPVRLLLDARPVLGLDGVTMADAVREMLATQAADARLLDAAVTAKELADLSYAELDGHLTGHPCMVLSKGRLGFSAADAARYTPEAQQPVRLLWLAAHRELAVYNATPDLPADALLLDELDPATRHRFAVALAEAVADPSAYHWLPVHPWHWDETVAPLFAAQLASRRLVLLGEAPDRYLPLQSVRTLANIDRPLARNVKLPLMIRNTLVWRGISPEPTAAAPEISGWLTAIRDGDPLLRDFTPLGEVASVAVTHRAYGEIPDAPYRCHELLGALWRQPVSSLLGPGERARSMAALLHVSSDDRALVTELVERSGLGAREWLARFCGVLLPPLLHYLYRYGVAFCPHGENTVVIYDRSEIPVRVAVKDLAEDVNLLPDQLPEYADLPARAAGVLLRWPAAELAHSILSAVVAGHLRHFAGVVEDHLGLLERELWALVRKEIEDYHARFPELADRAAAFGLLAPEFDRVALNREQLTGGGFHDRAEKDEGFDLMHGRVPNPLAVRP